MEIIRLSMFFVGRCFILNYSRKKKKEERQFEKITVENQYRLVLFVVAFTMFLFLLIGRLAYIQLIKGNDYYNIATKQWFKELPLITKRGNIYDRNGISFTSRHTTGFLILFPEYFLCNHENIKLISQITGLSIENIRDNKLTSNRPIKLEIKNHDFHLLKKAMAIRGIFPIDEESRYDKNSLAAHVIGYINKIDNRGAKGLEKMYDQELKGDQTYKIGAIVDAKKRIIPGLGYRVIGNSEKDNKKNIITTLDYNIQNIVENELDRLQVKGSVVVLDVKSGDILSMASRPDFDQNNVASYLNSHNRELYNRAIQISYPPGSIFKIIVTAAALENGIEDIDESFLCKGYEQIENLRIKCTSFDKGGHGEISLEDAFTVSCNSIFIQLGQKIGGKKIIETASKFGLGSLTKIGLPEEVRGKLPSEEYMKGAGIGNISIGQGSLEVTPLQIAKMTSIIANDGIDTGVRLVNKIIDHQENVIYKGNKNTYKRIISDDTARKIKRMMESVVREGTGRKIQADKIGGAAGKTGSSQALEKGNKTTHAWFTGYFPIHKPQYVITVIIENGESGGKVAAPIFNTIAQRIYEQKNK